jgi:hypothetical protein
MPRIYFDPREFTAYGLSSQRSFIAESLSMKPEDFSAAKSVRWISAFMEAIVFLDMKSEAWWGK